MEWQKGVPPEKHGYFLVAWRPSNAINERVIVSELWYNEDAIYPWWFTRGYIGQTRQPGIREALSQEVIAWMPMPDPPEDI